MSALATAQDIITKFELYAGDETELSSQEEIDLLQKIYNEVCEADEWEVLKTEFTGVQSTSVPYVALPSNFIQMMKNKDRNQKVVYVGAKYDPYYVITFDERRNYRDQKGYCYVDVATSRLYFTRQPDSAESIEFDYLAYPPVLTTSSVLVFPPRYWDVFYFGMLLDNDIIQMNDKRRAYEKENTLEFQKILQNMRNWNAGFYQDYGIA